MAVLLKQIVYCSILCPTGTISAAQTFDNYSRIEHIMEMYLLKHFGTEDQPSTEQTNGAHEFPLRVT